MVEVWLPYRDTEIPIMLPDPINLKIMPKTIYPSRIEKYALEKLDLILSRFKEPKIYIPIYADNVERDFIRGVLTRRGIRYIEVDEPGKADIAIDIFRFDPLIGFRSSIWVDELHDDPLGKLKGYMVKEEKIPNRITGDKLYIDLLLDGGARIYDIYASRDGSHYKDILNVYSSGWCLRSEPSPLIIASMGGFPWDRSLILYLASLSKIPIIADPEVGVLTVAGVNLHNLDPTILKDLSIDKAENVDQLYLAYSIESLRNINIIHYGSIPKTILSLIGFSKTNNPERFLARIPMSKKRDILVIEDLYLLYPSICVREEVEGEA